VHYETARAWKRKAKEDHDDWDQARQADRMAKGGLGDLTTAVLEDFFLQFKRSIDDMRTATDISPMDRAEILARLSDSYVKTVKAAGNSNSGMARLSVALEVLAALSQFIQQRYPHHTALLVEVLEPFGTELSKKYGS
jgi:hypothetical protein